MPSGLANVIVNSFCEDVTIVVSKLGWIRIIKLRDVDPKDIKYSIIENNMGGDESG